MKKQIIAAALLGFAIQPGLPAAEQVLSTASLAFPTIQEGAGARAIGLGSTYVGIAQGSAALLWNPAGLSTLSASEIAIHHAVALMGGTQDVAVLGVPVGYGNAFGLSLAYDDNGVFDGRDSLGAPTGDYSSRLYGGSLGWGIGSASGLSAGLAVKLNRRDQAGIVSQAFAGDAGLLWNLGPHFSLGAAYTNLGPEVGGHPLAQGIRVGVSTVLNKCEDFEWLLALSEESITRGDNSVHVGLEHTLYRTLALRAGYAFNFPNPTPEGLVGWTFGGGVAFQGLTLDYAFVPLGEVGNMQRVSLTYSFGDRCAVTAVPSPAPAATPAEAPPIVLLQPEPIALATATPMPPPPVALAEPELLPLAAPPAYVVKKGDSLWSISGQDKVFGDSFAWPLLFKANRDQIVDPDMIDPSQQLHYRAAYSLGEISQAVEKAKETPRYEPHSEPRTPLLIKY